MQGREDEGGVCIEKSSSLALQWLEILADSFDFPLPLSLSLHFLFIFFFTFLFQSLPLSRITDIYAYGPMILGLHNMFTLYIYENVLSLGGPRP